jgi:hypothetical protein
MKNGILWHAGILFVFLIILLAAGCGHLHWNAGVGGSI